MKNDNQLRKEEGLPEVAQDNHQRKPMIIILVGLMIVIFSSMYFFTRTDRKLQKPIEDNYSVQTDLPIASNRAVPATDKNIATTQAPPSFDPKVMQQQVALIEEKQKELQQRLSAPLMLVNGTQTTSATNTLPATQSMSRDANTQFMNQVSAQNSNVAMATLMGPLNFIIAEGSFIHAILEPATNSDLPGNLRAVVSEPVYSEDGTRVLVPQGSRLVGQYKSGMLQGQSRIFVVWTRAITPDGISVQLGSPGIDSIGVAGMGADEIDRHFWERFGTASLLSLLGAGAADLGVNGQDVNNSAATYRTAIANSFAQSAEQSLQQENMIAPTLKTYQGKPIMVFVAHDLNFQQAMAKAQPKMNVF